MTEIQQTLRATRLLPHHAAIALVALMTLVHIALAFVAELGGDEAHYALYGLMPDWSYFDHPPLVGWLQIIPMWLFPSDWGARIVPIGLYVALNWLLYRLTLSLFLALPLRAASSSPASNQQTEQACSVCDWRGFWSIALLNGTLMFPLMGFGMLPDDPLLVIVLALVWLVWEMLKTEQASLKQWLLLGLLVGLAALSKYTAVTLVVSLLAVLIIEKRWQWLTDKGLWLAVLVALLVISPLIYWNAIHDWASFVYQLNHGTHNPDWRLERLLRSQAAQFAVYLPLLFLLGWWMLFARHNYRSRPHRLLLLFALPVFALFLWSSGREENLPHWPSLAWLLLIPLVVDWLWQRRQRLMIRGLVYLQILFSVILVTLLHSLMFSSWIAFDDHKHPLQGELGWEAAAQTATELQTQLTNESNPAQPLPLFVSNWSYASHLTWYVRPQPVYVTTGKQTQFEFWFGRAAPGMDGLLVVPHYETVPPQTNRPNRFEQCEPVKTLPIESKHSIIVSYYFYHCRNYLR